MWNIFPLSTAPCCSALFIPGKHLRQSLTAGVKRQAVVLLASLLQCWVRTTAGVQFMTAMNVCSCWSRTGASATAQPSRPCRSKTSTTMQVMCAFKQRFYSLFQKTLRKMVCKSRKMILYLCHSSSFFCLDWNLPARLLDLAYYFKVDLNICIVLSCSVIWTLK